jgi:hypothetical protein
VPSIRRLGLLPSASGAQSITPKLYACPPKHRNTCLRSYCKPLTFPNGKEFTVLFGISGTICNTIKRRKGNVQKLYEPDAYSVEFIEFECLRGSILTGEESLQIMDPDGSTTKKAKRLREIERRKGHAQQLYMHASSYRRFRKCHLKQRCRILKQGLLKQKRKRKQAQAKTRKQKKCN